MPEPNVKEQTKGRRRGVGARDRSNGSRIRRYTAQHPITALCVVAIGLTVPLQTALLVAGLDVLPGKLAELLFLTGTATLITHSIGGRSAVRRLFGGLIQWRFGVGRWSMIVLAMPTLTVAVAAITGTLHSPDHGWPREGLTYVLVLLLILLTASLWEETAWSGFVQRRLINRRGLLVGSLLTAIPVRVDPPAAGLRGRRLGQDDLDPGLRQLGLPAGLAAVPPLPRRRAPRGHARQCARGRRPARVLQRLRSHVRHT